MEIARIKDGVMAYAVQHMMPKMDSKGQFLLGMSLAAVGSRMEIILRGLADKEPLKSLGIIRGEEVDWDMIYDAAMIQMQRQKKLVLDVPIVGRLTFDEQDLRDLHMLIKGGVN